MTPRRGGMKDVHPIWMDVQNGSIYPVFDVLKGSGTDGTFTYPDQATDPYARRARRRTSGRCRQAGVLVHTFGHLHPGGLHVDLDLAARRQGRAPLRVEREVLRARGRGVVGRVDDRDARRLGGRGDSRATC